MNTELIERWINGDRKRASRLMEEVSISESHLKNIRRGLKPSDRVLKLIARSIGCEVAELITGTAQRTARAR